MARSDIDTSHTREGVHASGIVKRYSGVPALRGVDLDVWPGQVVGLVGHNGAGKSTLLKCLSGAVTPDEGRISVNGRVLRFEGPAEVLDAGVSTVYQELSLHDNLTVAQNVFLGRESTAGGRLDLRSMRLESARLVKEFDLDVDVDRRLSEYSVATRQLLEVAVACGRRAKYLLLDEPTTSLERGQVERFLGQVQRLAESGLGIVLVDHKLDELYEVAERLVVLVDGAVVISAPAAEVDRDAVVRAIAGEEAATHIAMSSANADTHASHLAVGEPALEVSHVRTQALADVSLKAYPGRVLGLYGLIGSGRTELLRALIGLDTILDGDISLFGESYTPQSPADAQRRGLVYLTEERKLDGIINGLDSTLNVSLPFLDRYTSFGVLNLTAMREAAAQLMDRVSVRGDRTAPVTTLSGGNQQKVLFARALGQQPKVLLLDEPTKGVDIGVKSQIHRMLRTLAHDEGLAVVVVSSEEEEVLEVADDVATFSGGHCTGEVMARSDLSLAKLRHAAWAVAK